MASSKHQPSSAEKEWRETQSEESDDDDAFVDVGSHPASQTVSTNQLACVSDAIEQDTTLTEAKPAAPAQVENDNNNAKVPIKESSNSNNGETARSSPTMAEASTENMELNDTSAVGKAKALFGMMSKFIGVKDIVNLRISLPASLLDPISNLEYWNYMDRPDLFVTIPDSDDSLDRMLNVIKWWFSKETKFFNGRVAKPYNSIVGEQFFCHWDVDSSKSSHGSASAPHVPLLQAYPSSVSQNSNTPSSSPPRSPHSNVKVYCVTEQISHHPAASSFYYYCPDKGIVARGVDHMAAKFSGTSVKISAGELNHGIYISLESRDYEEYQITHQTGAIYGWLKGSLWVSACDECIVSCPKTGMRAILEYKEEPMFGRARYAVQGKVFKYDPAAESETLVKKLSKIPDEYVLCHINGCWKNQVLYQKTKGVGGVSGPATTSKTVIAKSSASFMSDSTANTVNTRFSRGSNIAYPAADTFEVLVDLTGSQVAEKIVRPIEEQGEWESRKIWKDVTENIISGNFGEATRVKREIEDRQRLSEKSRKTKGQLYKSTWFGFLDQNSVQSCICSEIELSIEGDTNKQLLAGKPFFRLDALEKLPWVSYHTPKST